MKEYKDIKITVNPNCVCIVDAWKINSDEDKREILNAINEDLCPIFEKRTMRSLMNEWKVHNAFYRRKWMTKRTKDCDLEFKQNFILKLLYSILRRLIRE